MPAFISFGGTCATFPPEPTRERVGAPGGAGQGRPQAARGVGCLDRRPTRRAMLVPVTRCIINVMDEDLTALRERIAALPDEEQAAAIFALEAIEDELDARAVEQMIVERTAGSPPAV